jgi:hypothetical protein
VIRLRAGEPHEPWNWTQRFVGASLLSLLLAAVQLNWFGLLPGTNSDLLTQGALLALIGLFALRISPVGMAVGLVVAYVAIFVDQATAGIGITPLRFTPGAEFWTITLPRVCLTWMAFPLLTWTVSRFAPPLAGGLVIGASLLVLPFIRYDPAPSLLNALLVPGPGRFLVLAVPWLQLCTLVAVLASAVLWLRRVRPQKMPAVVAALVVVTIVLPLATRATRELEASVNIAVSPSSGGPLTEVTVRAGFQDARTPILTWDGERVLRDALLAPLHVGITARAELSFLPASVARSGPGPHEVGVRMGTDSRAGSFHVVSPGGLSLRTDRERRVLIQGVPLQPLRVFVDGDTDGPQLLDVAFDTSGVWRSPLALPTGQFRIIAQSDGSWDMLVVR